jgi:hypothetical protein
MGCRSLLLVPFLATSLGAQGARPDLGPLHARIRELFQRYYPGATCELTGDRIHFEFRTRNFCLHEALMTGEWQEASEVRGPERGGIWGNIQYIQGPYTGQAMVPGGSDKRYFQEHLRAPYSAVLDAHLHVLVRFPPGFHGEFLNELVDCVDHFDLYLKPGSASR